MQSLKTEKKIVKDAARKHFQEIEKVGQDDENSDLPDEDKFQYLIQSTEENSPARNLVESFPPSANNYKIAVDQLKTRFARDEVLIQVYVRELLSLVLSQHISPEKSGMALSNLYDKLETQLRALETLGVTTDKYATMLLPLVESAIPHELLKIWERDRLTNDYFVNELQGLLKFLKAEVEADERIKLAQTSFSLEKGVKMGQDRCSVEVLHVKNTEIKGKLNFSCIFCDSNSHNSQDCIRAQKMTLEQKKTTVAKKRGCFSCLKPNHSFRTCKSIVKCVKCTRKHHALMCPDLHEKEKEKKDAIGRRELSKR
ncbi:uncharacterized protein LOC123685302 [Harmonia axyridis]|uniref:uncharacterized protein LOC123685302 n=1 Tax=Harmonia axyridis TaxID=115357 RepID=UPI001E27659E|nr:uncharacterized protein LOC123685302 [Harmonia axyridis]